jgi:hypothetical protein
MNTEYDNKMKAMLRGLINSTHNDPKNIEAFNSSVNNAREWCNRLGVNVEDKSEVNTLITFMAMVSPDKDLIYVALGCGYILGQESMKNKENS